MPGRIVPVRVGDVDLLVETSPVSGSEPTSAVDRATDAVGDAFERARSTILAVATSTAETITEMGGRAVRPQQVQVKFGVKFSAKGNVIVAGAAGEATLEITLTYDGGAPPAG